MLYAIFSVYLSRKPEDTFELCWGELSLKIPKDDIWRKAAYLPEIIAVYNKREATQVTNKAWKAL